MVIIAAGTSPLVQVVPNSKVIVPVIVDFSAASAGMNLASLSTGIAWSTSRLTLDSIKAGTFGTFSANTSNAASGGASFSISNASGATSSVALSTLYFTASATSGGTEVSLAPTAAANESGGSMLAKIWTRALAVCVAPTGLWADVNDDGAANIIDAQQIARFTVGLTVLNDAALRARGDVTGDGNINVIDAQQVSRSTVGLPAPARIGTPVSVPPTVASVAMSPTTPTIAVGGSTQLTAEPRDATAAALTGCAAVTWTSSDITKATVSPSGVVTGISAGAPTISATSAGQTISTTVFVTAPATWTGATSASWTTASNWNPAVVPATTAAVLVPAGTPNAPTLQATTSVGNLTIAGGATLNTGTFQLNVAGDVIATGGSIAGAGSVYLCSGAHQVAGSLGSVVTDCSGTVNPSGSVTIAQLTTQGGSVFNVGTASVMVSGNLSVLSGSRIKMTQAAGYLRVDGLANFNPANDIGDSYMTDGTLELRGNLQALNSCCGQTFRAVGNHLTRFNGSSAQSVNFAYTSNNSQSSFGRVEFIGNNTVTLVNGLRAFGSVSVTGTTALTGGTLYHGGLLTTASGTSLAGLAATELITAGTSFPAIGGAPPAEVRLNSGAVVTLVSNTVTLGAGLVLTNGTTLDLEAKSLTVTGRLGMYSGSRIKMTQAAAYMRVDGLADFNPSNDIGDTYMTDGTLELRGNMQSLNSCCGQTFRAVGNHLTRFNGTDAQSVNLTYTSNNSQSSFGRVEFIGNNTVTLVNGLRAFGSVSVTGTTALNGATLFHGGPLTTASGTSLAGLAATELITGGTSFPEIGGSVPAVVRLNSGAVVKLVSNTITLGTGLVLTNGTTLDMEAKSLTVTGSLGMYSGSRIKMTQAAAYMRVDGLADFNPANDIGDSYMTDGTLELRGNMQSLNSCCGQTFRAVGNHLTRFNGTDAQSVNFTYTSNNAQSSFGRVEFIGNNTVTLVNGLRAFGSVSVTGTTALTGTTLYHGGPLTTASGTSLAGLAATELITGGTSFPEIGGSVPAVVRLNSGAVVKLVSNTITLGTGLVLTNGTTLDLEAKSLTVTGGLGMYSGSRIKMTQAAAYLRVDGLADFNPANDIGDTYMTDGTLELRGNMQSLNSCCGQTFRAVGNHLTRFNSSSAQSVNLTYTSNNAQSSFGRVEFIGNNTVTLVNGLRAFGTVSVTGTTALIGTRLYHGRQLTAAAATDLSGLAATEMISGGTTFPIISGAPPQLVTLGSGAVVTLQANTVTLSSALTLTNGTTLDLEAKSLTVSGNFGMYSGSRIKMTQAAAFFRIDGLADFNPANDVGNTYLTNGVLEFRGDVQALNACCAQPFRAVGNHLARFNGGAAQSLNFLYGGSSTQSAFANVEIANSSSAGFSVASGMSVLGSLVNTGKFSIPASRTVTVAGTVTLGVTSTTTNLGTFTKGSCSAAPGATISGFSCP
ncbi:MAG: Ig-like domain-containing protein [Gemmatimonadota bacterium]